MSIYGSDELVPAGFAAVEAVATMLRASSYVVTTYFIDSTDHVYAHFHDEELPERLLVVRELSFAGGRTSNHGKIDDVPLQVMAMIKSTLTDGTENSNTHRWLAAMHRRVQRAIVGQSLSLHVGTTLLPVRIEQYPSTPSLDTVIRYWYSTAQYNVTLNAVSP